MLNEEDVWKVIYEVGEFNLAAPLDLEKEVDYFFKDIDVELTDSMESFYDPKRKKLQVSEYTNMGEVAELAQKVFDETPSDEPEFKPITEEDYQNYLEGREAAKEILGEENMREKLDPPSDAEWRDKYVQEDPDSSNEVTKAGLSKLIKEKGWDVSELREKIGKELDEFKE